MKGAGRDDVQSKRRRRRHRSEKKVYNYLMYPRAYPSIIYVSARGYPRELYL